MLTEVAEAAEVDAAPRRPPATPAIAARVDEAIERAKLAFASKIDEYLATDTTGVDPNAEWARVKKDLKEELAVVKYRANRPDPAGVAVRDGGVFFVTDDTTFAAIIDLELVKRGSPVPLSYTYQDGSDDVDLETGRLMVGLTRYPSGFAAPTPTHGRKEREKAQEASPRHGVLLCRYSGGNKPRLYGGRNSGKTAMVKMNRRFLLRNGCDCVVSMASVTPFLPPPQQQKQQQQKLQPKLPNPPTNPQAPPPQAPPQPPPAQQQPQQQQPQPQPQPTLADCTDLKVKRITTRHLQMAIRGDEELDTLIKAAKPVTIIDLAPIHRSSRPTAGGGGDCNNNKGQELTGRTWQSDYFKRGGGDIPHIHKSLIGKKGEGTKKQ